MSQSPLSNPAALVAGAQLSVLSATNQHWTTFFSFSLWIRQLSRIRRKWAGLYLSFFIFYIFIFFIMSSLPFLFVCKMRTNFSKIKKIDKFVRGINWIWIGLDWGLEQWLTKQRSESQFWITQLLKIYFWNVPAFSSKQKDKQIQKDILKECRWW